MTAGGIAPAILLALGVVLELLAVLGVTVMRSVYDRLHYVTVAGFGALLIGAAILTREGFSLIGDKAIATGILFVILGPAVVHTTGRSLRTREHGAWNAGADKESQR